MLSLELELTDFDRRNTKPLPPVIKRWRKRWIKAIEKEKARASIHQLRIIKSNYSTVMFSNGIYTYN